MSSTSPSSALRTLKVVWPFVILLSCQALVAIVSLQLLSTVRAYVTAESLWSKSLGNALLSLGAYLDEGRAESYQEYLASISVNELDRRAREELDGGGSRTEAARLLRLAGNSPDDIDGLIRLFLLARHIEPFKGVITRWQITDPYMDEFQTLARTSFFLIKQQGPGPALVPLKRQLLDLHDRMMPETVAFSERLGQASRQLVRVLLIANVLVGALLVLLAVWRMHGLVQQRWRSERALQAEKERVQIILASIGDAVLALNAEGRLLYHNPAAERLLERSGLAAGTPVTQLFDIQSEDLPGSIKPLAERLLSEDWLASNESLGHQLVRADGACIPVALTVTALPRGDSGTGVVLVMHDQTRERAFLRDLAWQASHDALTGLLNRREFETRLERLLAREGLAQASLLFIDLDQFKIVNDTSGHCHGDRLLRQLCELLASQLDEDDCLARLGGDEFGVLLERRTPCAVEALAERLRLCVGALQFEAAGQGFRVGLSIGVVHLGGQALTPEEALRLADLACYAAKDKGRNRVQVFAPGDMELDRRHDEMTWVQRLHRALGEDRFRLYLQPILGLGSRTAADRHVEVLMRLEEEGKLIAPGAFIPAAERYGLMSDLDRWVIAAALARFAEIPGGLLDTLAINLSGHSLGEAGLTVFVKEQLQRWRIAPARICFEITETSAVANLDAARQFMEELRGLGVRFSLDDFGAGMSSFTYLKHLPVDYLKIDGSFVRHLLEDPVDSAMVEAINRLGHLTGKKTIAEFAENEAVVAALGALGVDYAQGYGIARPQPFTAETCRAWSRQVWRTGSGAGLAVLEAPEDGRQ
ncbi:putative bifunctional diguanylate cyclase/phosphodiesterase [Pseudomonas oryzihabitans]|uniref:Diguanylate cyclase (GGDEF)-like protein n=1 Tax=Pseudomonas oryzihabitans TaxID=47885 RepID=A0AAJ2BEQ8_9PSED|nr:EAL domain-containing protein [Pseudomonas psychrotolerans]MDR6232714.1 diguanylate cyclase (GGDEF)-like protein [Pseudomonas psychrotolerans]